jgi:hypothetical protein
VQERKQCHDGEYRRDHQPERAVGRPPDFFGAVEILVQSCIHPAIPVLPDSYPTVGACGNRDPKEPVQHVVVVGLTL